MHAQKHIALHSFPPILASKTSLYCLKVARATSSIWFPSPVDDPMHAQKRLRMFAVGVIITCVSHGLSDRIPG